MNDITETNYSLSSKGIYKIYYKLKSKERIQTRNKQSLKLSLKKSTAKQVLEYKIGHISFANVDISFESAYYYRGILYMQHSRGVMNGDSFNAKEVAFDRAKQQLSSNRVVFTKQNSISIKTRFFRVVPSKLNLL